MNKMNKNKEIKDWVIKQDLGMNNQHQMVINEMSAVFSESSTVHDAMNRYAKTAEYIEKLSSDIDFDYCCIKAMRVYPHFNTDLNIAISPVDFKRVIAALEKDNWSRRSRWSQFKENIAERGKRKLVTDSSRGHSEIHLYPGLSWHGYEYCSPKDVLHNRKRYTMNKVEIWNTNNSLDIVSNIGHALFERYKFTSGELFHLFSVIEKSSERELSIALEIANKNGWEEGLYKCIELIKDLHSREGVKYPILLPRSLLWVAWRSRFKWQLQRFQLVGALMELFFNIIWSGNVYKIYSFLKKKAVGSSGLEKKYGDML
jgi:hypothetical protein